MKTLEELIELGKSMVAKERSPRAIHAALQNHAPDKETLNAALEVVFEAEEKPTTRSAEYTKDLLREHRKKTSFLYARNFLPRTGLLIIGLGLATLLLSNARVNQNGIFAWITLGQGIVLFPLFWYIKKYDKNELILPAFLLFAGSWLIEILLFGMPGDLLSAYYEPGVRIVNKPPRGTAIARLIGFLYPFIYVFLKFIFAALIFFAYQRYTRYDRLDHETKHEIDRL